MIFTSVVLVENWKGGRQLCSLHITPHLACLKYFRIYTNDTIGRSGAHQDVWGELKISKDERVKVTASIDSNEHCQSSPSALSSGYYTDEGWVPKHLGCVPAAVLIRERLHGYS